MPVKHLFETTIRQSLGERQTPLAIHFSQHFAVRADFWLNGGLHTPLHSLLGSAPTLEIEQDVFPMAAVNLKTLVNKLNPICRRALEGAAGLCLSRTNYNVEIEHWLLKLLESADTDLAKILR